MWNKVILTCLLFSGSAWAELPNLERTPGAINAEITQETIKDTICNPHWSTKSIRPSVGYTNKLKKKQIIEYGYADKAMKDYEEDHLISLELGGSPTAPENLWPEPYAGKYGARVKDQIENKLHKLVCSGKLTLQEAQHMISTDWIKAYETYLP